MKGQVKVRSNNKQNFKTERAQKKTVPIPSITKILAITD